MEIKNLSINQSKLQAISVLTDMDVFAFYYSAERSRNQSGTLPHMIKSPRLSSAKSGRSTRTNTTNVTFYIYKPKEVSKQ